MVTQSNPELDFASARNQLSNVWEECRVPNWDGHGALPVEPSSYRNTQRLLELLPITTPSPTFGAEPDGSLTLEWHHSPVHTLSISVNTNEFIHYAALLGPNSLCGTELFEKRIPPRIIGLIHEVTEDA